ncbi:MAG: hypothetical protein ACFFBD_02190 [Candidatus Hodarchaeota archaeon]
MKKDLAILMAGGAVVIIALGAFAIIRPFDLITNITEPENPALLEFSPLIFYDDLDFNSRIDLIILQVKNLKQSLIYTDTFVVEYENGSQIIWSVPSTAILPNQNTTIRAYAPTAQQLRGGITVNLTIYFYRFVNEGRENLNSTATVLVPEIQYHNFNLRVVEGSGYARHHVAVVPASDIPSQGVLLPKNSIRVFDSQNNQVRSTILSLNSTNPYLEAKDEIIFEVTISAWTTEIFRLQASPQIFSPESRLELVCTKTTGLSPLPIYNIDQYNPDEDGFFRDWLTLGPFPNDKITHNGTFEDYIAYSSNQTESTVTPVEGYGTYVGYEKQTVQWDFYSSASSKVYLGENWNQNDWIVGYAFAYIVSPEDMEAELRIGSDDGISIFLNSEKVHQYHVSRACQADDDIIYVSLKKGINPLLVKVDNLYGSHCFVLRFNIGRGVDSPLYAIVPTWEEGAWSNDPLQVSFL